VLIYRYFRNIPLIHVFYSPWNIIPIVVKSMARILVAYATKKGSTTEIAQAIGKELNASGHVVDVADMRTISSVTGYNAVVIGGPVYVGKIDGVGKFVKRHSTDLARVPVAGFVVCLAAAAKDQEGMALAEKALHAALNPLRPVAETIFAGMLDPSKLSWLQKWVTEKAKSPVGDFRDWTAIAAWARDLPGKMGV
jgi:menaquinone-dependent protoporphyrinogen oxidase